MAALLALLMAAEAAAQTGSSPSRVDTFADRVQRLDRLFSQQAQEGGAYLLAYRHEERAVTRGYGSLGCSGGARMPAEALFDGGSLTKLFTTAAILKLVEAGKLKLDDAVGDLFSGVPKDKRSITIAQLLAHSSGIPDLLGPKGRPLPQAQWSVEGYDYAPLSRRQLLARIWSAPLQFQPGLQTAYSNAGFTLLAAVIETASGEPYEEYVRRNVFNPSGMRDTGYLSVDRDGLPVTQQCRDGGAWGDPLSRRVWKTGVSWNLMGAGGMMTTLADLQRFAAATEDGPLFRPDIRQRFQQMMYGASARCGTRSAAFGGSNGMTRSLILHLPSRREALVAVATHRERPLPEEGDMLEILCPGRAN
jgi:CubicO group peptidase (beta-lactamase class C family)